MPVPLQASAKISLRIPPHGFTNHDISTTRKSGFTMKSQHRLSGQSEILLPSTESSIKAECLKTAQAIFGKDLIEAEIKFWWEFLDCFTEQEVSYAFENWGRNGKFFPKPGDIRELVDAYRDSTRPAFKASANPGTGFGKIELLSLWGLVCERVETFRKGKEQYVPLTDQEIEKLCRQVEAKKRTA
jgi:hypothetical protein